MAGLIRYARAHPGAVSLGTTTAFNAAATEELSRLAAMQVTAVPYRGGGSMVVDLLAGRIGAGWASPQTAIAQMASGRIRILATAGETRSLLLPDVPTIIESGVPGFVSDAWFGLLGPAGLPPAIVARLHDAIVQAMRDPTVLARVHEFGTDGRIAGPDAFAARIRADDAKWAEAARSGLLPRVE